MILLKLLNKFQDRRWKNEKMEIMIIGSIAIWSTIIIRFITTDLSISENNGWGPLHSMIAIAVVLIIWAVRFISYLDRENLLNYFFQDFNELAFMLRSLFIIFCLSVAFCFWATWLIWFPVILAIGLCVAVYSISDSYYENSETYSVMPYLAIITGIISTVWQFWSHITYGIGYAFTASWNWIIKVLLLKVPLGSEDYTVFPLWTIAGVGIISVTIFLLYQNYLKEKRRQAEECERVRKTLENEKLNQARREDERKRNDKIWEKEQERQDALEKKVREADTPSWIDIFDSKRTFLPEILVRAPLVELIEISHMKKHLVFDSKLSNAFDRLNTLVSKSFTDPILEKVVEQFASFNQFFDQYTEYKGYDSIYRELSKNEDIMSLLEKSKEAKETPVAHV